MASNSNREQHLRCVLDAKARVASARERLKHAEQAERRAALEAVAAGVPLSQVADALGVSRMTVYRWAKAERSPDAANRSGRDRSRR